MNKLLLVAFLLLNICTAFAQVAPSTPTSIVDSSQAKPVVKPPDVQTGMSVSKSISENLFATSTYSRFYNILQAANLVETLGAAALLLYLYLMMWLLPNYQKGK